MCVGVIYVIKFSNKDARSSSYYSIIISFEVNYKLYYFQIYKILEKKTKNVSENGW